MSFTEVEQQGNSRYETYAYFYVSDFNGEASVITRKLELEPTETWMKGDSRLPHKPRPSSSWKLYSAVERSEIFLHAHIKAVLDIIEPKQVQIAELQAQGCTIGINCIGYYYGTHPGFGLSAELIARLAVFSMDVDFDLYCLCADSDEEKSQEFSES